MTEHVKIDDLTPRTRVSVGSTPSAGPFSFPWAFFDDGDVLVYDGADLIAADTYTVTGTAGTTGGYEGGSITLDVAVSDTILTIAREVPVKRITDFPAAGPFDIDALNTEIDRNVAMLQDYLDQSARALIAPVTDDPGLDLEIPLSDDRAGKFLAFDAMGTPIAAVGMTGVPATALGQTFLAETTAAGMRTVIDCPSTSDLSGVASAASAALSAGLATAYTPRGQCRLAKSGSNLVLSPLNGNRITIDGADYTIAAAGVSLAPPSNTITVTIASPGVFSWVGHGLVAGRPITFATSGALPTGLTAGTIYYVISSGLTADAFEVSATPGGTAVNTSGSQSGTHKAGTLRYVYCYNASGTLTLEASTTTHATDATTGIEIKNGDSTRTFVGMAFDSQSGSSTAWADDVSHRFVVSWWNRRSIGGYAYLTSSRSTSSGNYGELHIESRVFFLAWGDDAVGLFASGGVVVSASQSAYSGIAVDGVTPQDGVTQALNSTVSSEGYPFCCSSTVTISEGFHYANIVGFVSGGTSTWSGSASGAERCTMRVSIRG